MKKLILVIILWMITSCSFKNYEIYNQCYSVNQTEQIVNDIYTHFYIEGIDTVELKDWSIMQYSSERENIMRRVFTIKDGFNEQTVFVYSIHDTPDSTYYKFSIFKRIR